MVIKDRDYSNDLTRVRITESLDRPLTTVILDIFVDPRDIILDYIYGQDPIKLSVKYIGQSAPRMAKEQVDYTLVHYKSGFPLPLQRSHSKKDQPDRTAISILTVPEKDIIPLSSLVNNVYYSKTIEEITRDLASYAKASIEIDTEDINIEKIDQVIIPPVSLRRAIDYLDGTFGYYRGTMGWNFSDGTLKIFNLTRRMVKEEAFIIYQLVSGDDNSDVIDSCNDGKRFYTYELIRNDYAANTRFVTEAKNINYIVKPRNTLYGVVNLDLEEVCKSYGVISKRDAQIFFNPVLNRTKYHVDHIGYDDNNYFAVSRVTKPIRNLSKFLCLRRILEL